MLLRKFRGQSVQNLSVGQQGYTVLELLVVVAVICILIALLIWRQS